MTNGRVSVPDEATLYTSLTEMGIAPPAGATELLAKCLALLEKWNRAYNLTAVCGQGKVVTHHVLDSAAALSFLCGKEILDIGSGAGFPGLVLAILAPHTQWVLAESSGKKARFLAHVVRQLRLSDRVSVHAGRVERYPCGLRFDTVTARAVADLAALVRWAGPLLVPGGRLVALKGRRAVIDAELAALPGRWLAQVTPVEVPGLGAERHVVVLEQMQEQRVD